MRAALLWRAGHDDFISQSKLLVKFCCSQVAVKINYAALKRGEHHRTRARCALCTVDVLRAGRWSGALPILAQKSQRATELPLARDLTSPRLPPLRTMSPRSTKPTRKKPQSTSGGRALSRAPALMWIPEPVQRDTMQPVIPLRDFQESLIEFQDAPWIGFYFPLAYLT